MAKVTCKTCGGELEALVTWVHAESPRRRHEAEPLNHPSVELHEAPVREGTILHLVGRSRD